MRQFIRASHGRGLLLVGFLFMAILSGCVSVNCPDCAKPCGPGGIGDPGLCGQPVATGALPQCSAGGMKCPSEGSQCGFGLYCRTKDVGGGTCGCTCVR